MKKAICCNIFYFLFCSVIVGQSGVVTYKVYSYPKKDNLKRTSNLPNDMREQVEMLRNQAKEKKKELEFELIFNKGESLFQLKDKALFSDESFGMAKIQAGAHSKYYLNLEDNVKICQLNYLNQILINTNEEKCDWTITKETKKIDKYQVVKATCHTERMDKPRNKLITRDNYAWFTYEIPLGFGPGGLDGLPGLVLEGSINKYETYYATKIILEDKNMQKIKLPQCDKTMTYDELDIFMAEDLKRMKGNR